MSLLRMDFLHCALMALVVLLAIYVARGSFRETISSETLIPPFGPPPAELGNPGEEERIALGMGLPRMMGRLGQRSIYLDKS